MTIEYLKTKVEELENKIENNKLFLNMVVHDMRNPTCQLEYLLLSSLKLMNALMQ